MDLSLNKASVVRAGRRVRRAGGRRRGGLLLPLRDAGAGRHGARSRRSWTSCARTSTRAWPPRGSCREFRAQVADLETRLDSLQAVLPEEKDVGDLLRRLQTLATQSNLTIRGFKPRAGGDQAAARRVADQPRARRHVSQPRDLLRPRQQVHAHRQHRRTRREGEGPDRPERHDPAACVATTFVLLDKRQGPGEPRRRRPSRESPNEAPGARAASWWPHRPAGKRSRRPRSRPLPRRRRRRRPTPTTPRAAATRS